MYVYGCRHVYIGVWTCVWLRVSLYVCVCGVLCLLSTLGTVCTAAKYATQQHLQIGGCSIQISFHTHLDIYNCLLTLTFMRLFLFMVIFTLIFAVIQICIYTFSLRVLLGIWMRLSIYPPHTAPPLAPLGVHAGVIRCSDKLHYLAGLCEMQALY